MCQPADKAERIFDEFIEEHGGISVPYQTIASKLQDEGMDAQEAFEAVRDAIAQGRLVQSTDTPNFLLKP